MRKIQNGVPCEVFFLFLFFPSREIIKVCKVAVSNPVSIASCEQSFSALKRHTTSDTLWQLKGGLYFDVPSIQGGHNH